MAPPVKQRKIAILGSRNVGKSSLTVRYVEGHFVEVYYPTIESSFSQEIQYKGQTFLTEIIDTQGQDEYTLLNSKHFIGIHGYMLVYSVANQQSFDMVNVIHEKVLNHLGADNVPILLVGNKCDFAGPQRKISEEQGRKLANQLKGGFIETSARENKNVAEAFKLMISEIEKGSEPEKPAGNGKCSVM